MPRTCLWKSGATGAGGGGATTTGGFCVGVGVATGFGCSFVGDGFDAGTVLTGALDCGETSVAEGLDSGLGAATALVASSA